LYAKGKSSYQCLEEHRSLNLRKESNFKKQRASVFLTKIYLHQNENILLPEPLYKNGYQLYAQYQKQVVSHCPQAMFFITLSASLISSTGYVRSSLNLIVSLD
jgi:hypothetical protein